MDVSSVFTQITLGLLAVDTLRAIVAMMGVVPRDTKFLGNVIYGNYDRQLIIEGLKELGFTHQQGEEIKKELKAASDETLNTNGITFENAAQHLLALMAKYIVRFDNPIQYGGSSVTVSRYYIDTMEMAHNHEDRQKMVSIMSCLYVSVSNDDKKPDVVATPKGGNPLFVLNFAQHYSAEFVMIKSDTDKSRIVSVEDSVTNFKVNYEGSWGVKNRGQRQSEQKCIVVDCNTSGGSQLIHSVEELSHIATQDKELHLEAPELVLVLFRADVGKTEIDRKFFDHNCRLIRFFDLTEEIKEKIYELHKKAADEKRDPDIYYQDDAMQIKDIILMMKNEKLYYYIPKEKKSE